MGNELENMPPSFWQELINRLQISGNIESLQDQGINSVYGGGRVGYNFPLDNSNLNLGLLGSGYKVSGETPYGKINQSGLGLTGADAAYTSGLNTFGASYNQNPMEKVLNLFYNRQF